MRKNLNEEKIGNKRMTKKETRNIVLTKNERAKERLVLT